MFSSKSLMVRVSELGYWDHGGALAVKKYMKEDEDTYMAVVESIGMMAQIH